MADGYAWAHDTIGVNKDTFSTQNVPVEKMVRVPIGEEIKTAVLFGGKWTERQLEKNRLAACHKQTPEDAEREQDFVMSIIEKEHRQPTFDDAIKYGMKAQNEAMLEGKRYTEDGEKLFIRSYLEGVGVGLQANYESMKPTSEETALVVCHNQAIDDYLNNSRYQMNNKKTRQRQRKILESAYYTGAKDGRNVSLNKQIKNNGRDQLQIKW